jgi:chromosome segregation ATPase
MDHTQQDVINRLEAAATALERTLAWLEERQAALTGEVEKISATVEQSRKETELEAKLAAAEAEVAELKAAAAAAARPAAAVTQRRTTAVTEMLAKHGIAGDGPVDLRAVDEALKSLGLEQRIAIKSQLARAGAIA